MEIIEQKNSITEVIDWWAEQESGDNKGQNQYMREKNNTIHLI